MDLGGLGLSLSPSVWACWSFCLGILCLYSQTDLFQPRALLYCISVTVNLRRVAVVNVIGGDSSGLSL